MEETKKFSWATSSQDPQKISDRVKGIAIGSSAIIIFVATNVFGIQLQPQDVIDLGTQLGIVIGAVYSLYGFILSVVAYFTKK
jgi:hypothetical protein